MPDQLKPSIHKSVAAFDAGETCHYCSSPIFPGDPVYSCDTTFQVGCSEEHCFLASQAKIALFTKVVEE